MGPASASASSGSLSQSRNMSAHRLHPPPPSRGTLSFLIMSFRCAYLRTATNLLPLRLFQFLLPCQMPCGGARYVALVNIMHSPSQRAHKHSSF